MRYFVNPSTSRVRDAMTANPEQLGMIATPAQRLPVPADVVWCADNGCFGAGYPGDAAWLAWLASYSTEQIGRCAFATAPDVVGDARATHERAMPWLPEIRRLGYPAAYVAQNGLEDLAPPWDDFDVLFLGGDTAWKLGEHARDLTTAARARGKRVHMGRVNSERRMRYADAIGCDSTDGTHIAFAPDLNLARALTWLRGLSSPPLFELYPSDTHDAKEAR